eukprot:4627210-Amphidinium_carterae.2
MVADKKTEHLSKSPPAPGRGAGGHSPLDRFRCIPLKGKSKGSRLGTPGPLLGARDMELFSAKCRAS